MGLWVSREYLYRSPNIFFIAYNDFLYRKLEKIEFGNFLLVYFLYETHFFSKIVKNAVFSGWLRGKQQPKKSILDFIYFFRLPNNFALTNENKKMCIIYIWRTHNFFNKKICPKSVFFTYQGGKGKEKMQFWDITFLSHTHRFRLDQ